MTDTPQPPHFARLVGLLPELEQREGSGVTFDSTGTPPTFDGLAGKLYEVAHEDDCIMVGFDWPGHAHALRGYLARAALATADLDVCRKLLTIIVRQERFVEGSLSEHIETGFAARLVRQIAALTGTPLPAGAMVDIATVLLHDMEREDAEAFAPEAPPCPVCASVDVIPIVRGMPTPAAEAAARRGRAVLGGCIVWGEATLWMCCACKHEFGRFGELIEEKNDAR